MSAAVKVEHFGWSLLNGFGVPVSSATKGQPLRNHLFYGQTKTAGISSFVFDTACSGTTTRQASVFLFYASPRGGWGFIPTLSLPRFITLLHYALTFHSAI